MFLDACQQWILSVKYRWLSLIESLRPEMEGLDKEEN